MAPTTNRQNWSPMPGTRESGSASDFRAVVKYIGPWKERIVFAQSMMGEPYYQGILDDSVPDRDRFLDTSTAPFGVSYDIAPHIAEQDTRDDMPGVTWMEQYEKAVVTITYGFQGLNSPVQIIGDDRGRGDWITEHFEPNNDFQTMDEKHFEWIDTLQNPITLSAADKKLEAKDAPGKLVAGMDYVFTRHGVQNISPQTLTFVDHVNKFNLKMLTPIFGGHIFTQETLWYKGYRINRNVTMTGDTNMDISMVFAIRQIPDPNNDPVGNPAGQIFYGWNHFFHPGLGKYLQLKRKSNGAIHRNFERMDLKLL